MSTTLEMRGDASLAANAQTLESFLQTLSRRRFWILFPLLACMALVIAYTTMMKPTYESTVTVELNKNGSGMDLGMGNQLSEALNTGADTLLTDMQTETAILQDDSLAMAVIRKLNLAHQPPFAAVNREDGNASQEPFAQVEASPAERARLLLIFHRRLKVRPIPGTRLIQVSFDSHDPVQAAEIANALVDAYKDYYLQSHYDAITDTSRWLTSQLSDLKSSVDASEKKLTDFEKASGIVGLNLAGSSSSDGGQGDGGAAQIHSPVIQKLDALNAELTKAEADRITSEAIYRITSSGNADVVLGLQNSPLLDGAGVTAEGPGLSRLQALRGMETQLRMQMAQEATTYGSKNRHLLDLQTQMQTLNGQIAQELDNIKRQAKADLTLAEQTEAGIRQQFDQQQAAASKLNDVAIQFAMLSEEAYTHKRLYDDLYTRLQEANVAAGIRATNITVVDPAQPPAKPFKPRPVEYIALGTLFGLFVGIGAAYTVDALDYTVASPHAVEMITGRPVIGIIPELRELHGGYRLSYKRRKQPPPETAPQPGAAIWVSAHPDSNGAESIRALRTAVLLSRAGAGPRVVLVTSCVPGEGKTTVSINLAFAFALHNKRVILVEADMRRPRIKAMANVPTDLGLSNVLTGSATLEEAVDRGRLLPTLDILAGGPCPPNPSEILGSSIFDALIEQLRNAYDLVLIDTPPALLVTDSTLIATQSDVAIWVAGAGVVTRPQLVRAARMIERGNIPVIGFVMNRFSAKMGGYGYGYEYDHYDSYYGQRSSHDQ